MRHSIEEYATIVFDCDGVVLNSNKVKTQAFYHAALPYGEMAAQELVNYHVTNGGISRYKKFAYFLDKIVADQTGPDLETLLEAYVSQVRQGLLSCEVAPGLENLRAHTSNARWLIVSGGDQTELKDILVQRGLGDLFDGGIFGSPDTKDEILNREVGNGNIQSPALFLGDSKYDYLASTAAGLDFVFVRGWSEFMNWRDFFKNKDTFYIEFISQLTAF